MQRFFPLLKLNKVIDAFPAPPAPAMPAPPAPANPPAPEASGDTHDDYGYEKETPAAAPADPAKPAQKTGESPPPEKVEAPATGYGAEIPEPEVLPPAPPSAPVVPPVLDELDKALDGLEKTEHAKIKEFATKHAITVDQAKAYAEMRKAEYAEFKALNERLDKEALAERQKKRISWQKELKEDPTFGGEKFETNVAKAEKVLEKHLSNFKKSLTESKAMLPPYVMRDLAALHDVLYSTETLVQGDPIAPKDETSDDPLAYYT